MPYRPSPSPSQQLQDQSTRGALDALQISASQQNARMLAHQQQQMANEQLYGPNGGGAGGDINGDMGQGGMMNGHQQNGISRPSSSTGYLQPPPNNGSNNGASPGSINGPPGGNGPSPRPNSPSLHISLPPPPSHFTAPTTDMTPGGTTRPFAGAPQSATPVPSAPNDLPPSQQQQQQHQQRQQQQSNGGDLPVGDGGAGSYQFNTSGEDMYADLSLDFAFDDFLADNAFKDDLGEG